MPKALRVIIVEDSEDDLLLLLRELRRGGYDPEHVRVESEAALRDALDRQGWDLVLSDYNLPGFDGIAALKFCRDCKLDLPFIVVSGAVGEEVAVDLMKAGAHDFIRKDNLSRLVPAIERELQEAEMRRQRRLAEQALRESEEKFRALVDSSPDAILSLDRDARILSFNSAAVTMWGYGAEDVIGTSLLESGIITKASRARASDELERTFAGETRPPYELTTRHLDGEEVYVEANALLMRESRGGSRVQLALRNITERRKLESQLQLSQKMEAIGQLAGGVAHDFNNQLSGIIGCSEILRSEVEGDEELTWFVDIISTAAEQAAGLTRQLLAFARKSKYQTTPVHIHEVIAEVVPLLEHTLDRRIRIVRELQAEPDLVLGDPSQLQNAVLNLALNARDAMPDGGPLTFATKTTELDPEFCRSHPNQAVPGMYLQISVRDSGVGIDQATMPHIFEPFFTTKPIGKGTGLGLAAVYGTVKSHNGTISVSSEPDKGTTFNLFLPLDQETNAADVKPGGEDSVSGTGHILVIDDEAIVRSIAERMLVRMGYEVSVATDGPEGIEAFDQLKDELKLVILDMVMPSMSGRDVFFELRRLDPNARILVASGHVMSEDIQEVLEAGAMDFIQKPFRLNALSTKVAQAMQTS